MKRDGVAASKNWRTQGFPTSIVVERVYTGKNRHSESVSDRKRDMAFDQNGMQTPRSIHGLRHVFVIKETPDPSHFFKKTGTSLKNSGNRGKRF